MFKTLAIRGWMLLLLYFLAVPAHAEPPHNEQPYLVATEADDVVTRVLFDAIAYQFNIDIQYINYPSFDAILKSVESGESDFAANVTYTEARAKRFDYSAPTNIEYTYLYSYTNATLDEIKRIGVPKGTIYGELIRENYPHLTQVEYDGFSEAKVLLESAQVDGVVDAINQLKPMLTRGLDAQLLNDRISIQPVSLIVPKGKHGELLHEFETFIHSAKVQKLLRESIQKYQFDIRKQALRQAVIDSGVNQQRPLRVKLENLTQFARYGNDGSVKGISADVVFQACDILLLKCDLVSAADETWESMFTDIQDKHIDIIAPISISEQRKKMVYFSESYYHPQAVMVKREGYKDNVYSNVSELVVERIGVIKDDFFEELMQRMLPNKALITFSNQEEQIQALLDKQVDYIVLSKANFNQILRDADSLLPIVEDSMIGSFYAYDIAIGFPKNQVGAALAPLFTRAIKIIDTQKIIKKYDYQPDWRATLLTEKRFARHSQWLFILLVLFLLSVALYLNFQSNTDNLTKLRNRRSLYRRFRRGLPGKTTLVYLDMNQFKPINDNYGHEIGDKVLKQLAARINQVWKGKSYRIGGDEFILVGEARGDELQAIIDQLQSFLFICTERDVSFDVTVAVGISTERERYMSLQEVLHQTDIAMYQEKRKRPLAKAERPAKEPMEVK
ncbi:GGDEF domain-containing protein [Vibrio fluvialis]|uniref:GGDEF domain-containing protein n=1 Tax=Vibrio fluvialis TaxID=676 RepID=UPI003F694101